MVAPTKADRDLPSITVPENFTAFCTKTDVDKQKREKAIRVVRDPPRTNVSSFATLALFDLLMNMFVAVCFGKTISPILTEGYL